MIGLGSSACISDTGINIFRNYGQTFDRVTLAMSPMLNRHRAQGGNNVGEQGRLEENHGQVRHEPHEGGAQARDRLGRCNSVTVVTASSNPYSSKAARIWFGKLPVVHCNRQSI